MSAKSVCARCVLDDTVPGIRFDDWGVCNHCGLYDKLDRKFARTVESESRFLRLIDKIKAKGKDNAYDCVIGLSGGTDSSYCLCMARKLGLRPLAVHFDNGWVSEVARQNIDRLSKALDVDLITVGADWSELRDYYRACLEASIPEMCLPCMVGITSSLYEAASELGIRYIILGTSFRTEGLTPARWYYWDGAYFDTVIKSFGVRNGQSHKFNKMRLSDFARYVVINGIRTIQLPLYVEYRDADIKRTLKEEVGWQDGGYHHFDCMYKPFLAYVQAKKFNMDLRMISLSAQVRGGAMARAEALRILQEPAFPSNGTAIDYCMKKLGLTPGELRQILASDTKSFLDYHSYYDYMRPLRPLAKALGRLNLVPETFYERYFELV